MDLSLILPCYNEENIFGASVGQIVRTLSLSRLTYEIIFVDDKSRDRTPLLIKQTLGQYQFCRALFHPKNMGRGKTVTDGIRVARGKVVGYVDIDLEVSPVYVSSMVQSILDGEADVVIGRRMYRSTLSSLVREVFSVGYQWLAKQLVGTAGYDTESGYKFFNRSKILPILKQATHPHWFWDTEIVVCARRAGLRVVEVPVLFLRRFDKQSSVRLLRDISDYIVSLWRFRQRLNDGRKG